MPALLYQECIYCCFMCTSDVVAVLHYRGESSPPLVASSTSGNTPVVQAPIFPEFFGSGKISWDTLVASTTGCTKSVEQNSGGCTVVAAAL